VDAWKGTTLPELQALGDSDWQYSVKSGCGPTLPLKALAKDSSAENLLAENQERDVFGAYDRLKFVDTSPAPVAGQLTKANDGCTLNFGVFFKKQLVRHHPAIHLHSVSFALHKGDKCGL
jgi:hypothetical protein